MIELKLDSVSVKILKDVFERMFAYIQDKANKPEAGGILLGYYFNKNNFSIIDISLPNKEDRASRYGFIRSMKTAQKVINERFNESKGKIIYLGEWHTHPEDFPDPSWVDKKSIIERLRKDDLNSEIIFSLIIGRKGFYIAPVDKDGILSEKRINYKEINLLDEF